MTKRGHDEARLLQYRVEERDGVTWVALSGNLTENADFGALTKLRGPLVFDLADIGRINSLGARHWIYFVRSCETAGVELTLERCAPVFVSQISMISNFVGSRAHVKSMYAPYVCGSCNHEHLELIEILPSMVEVQSTFACPKCGDTMELDELPQTYAGFFQRS